MTIYKDVITSILAAVNAQNSVAVTKTDVVFSAPKDIRNTATATATGKNTQLKLTGGGTGSNWTGSVVVSYNRLNLGDLTMLVGANIPMLGCVTYHDLLPFINARWGMVLTTDDIVDGDITLSEDGYTGSGTLVAKTTSLGWIGSWAFTVSKGDALLTTTVTTSVLDGLKYPTGDLGSTTPGYMIAEIYSYGLDWAPYNTDTTALTLGALTDNQVTALNNDIAAITGYSGWTNTTQYTFAGGAVQYNGLTTGYSDANQNYKYVAIVKLGTATSIKGLMYLHYNDTEDTTEV